MDKKLGRAEGTSVQLFLVKDRRDMICDMQLMHQKSIRIRMEPSVTLTKVLNEPLTGF